MKKHSLTIAVVCLTGLASCATPPPPRFETDPMAVSDPVVSDTPQSEASLPTDPPPPVTTGDYPTAKRTDNPDQVISPYEPFNVIDVAGFASGKLARDPSNQKIFRVP